MKYIPIPEKRKKEILKFFDAKLIFLSEDKKYIEKPIARVLSYLHHYRNEAYHRDIVRKETIRPATILLFEIASDLFVKLTPSSISCGANENDKWLKEKYEVTCWDLINKESREKIFNILKSDLPLDLNGIKDILIKHLINRIDDVLEQLQDITKSFPDLSSHEQALKSIQYWNIDRTRDPFKRDREFEKFIPKYTMESFRLWKTELSSLATIENKLELFDRFANIEQELEPIEKQIGEIVGLIEDIVEEEIDRMRGK